MEHHYLKLRKYDLSGHKKINGYLVYVHYCPAWAKISQRKLNTHFILQFEPRTVIWITIICCWLEGFAAPVSLAFLKLSFIMQVCWDEREPAVLTAAV